jgi:4'-phosphopantetheinyl transferase
VYYGDTRVLDDAHLAALDHLLSPSERARRNRLWRADDRRDYSAAHALLRIALAAQTQQPPERLAFRTDRNGKAFLASGSGVLPSFSLSHARGLVACAIAETGVVGIDVEPVDHAVDALKIAGQYFSADEAAALARCSVDERASRFCELWTLKEARLKALGTGLASPLDSVSFSVDEHRIRVAPPEERWALALMDVEGAYKLAVAIDDGENQRARVYVTKVNLLEPDAWSS